MADRMLFMQVHESLGLASLYSDREGVELLTIEGESKVVFAALRAGDPSPQKIGEDLWHQFDIAAGAAAKWIAAAVNEGAELTTAPTGILQWVKESAPDHMRDWSRLRSLLIAAAIVAPHETEATFMRAIEQQECCATCRYYGGEEAFVFHSIDRKVESYGGAYSNMRRGWHGAGMCTRFPPVVIHPDEGHDRKDGCEWAAEWSQPPIEFRVVELAHDDELELAVEQIFDSKGVKISYNWPPWCGEYRRAEHVRFFNAEVPFRNEDQF